MADNMSKTQYANKRAEDMTLNAYKQIIRDAEGLKLEAYKPDDTEEYFTIGYGHYGNDVGEDDVITKEDAESMLDEDVRIRLESIVDLLPKFNSFPQPLKDALFSEHYRGSIQDSPKTRELINASDFAAAAEEYLDNDEYRRAETDKQITGIRARMEKVSEELKKLAE
jgi:GH24 family phage-related lysozyme (muramidase)